MRRAALFALVLAALAPAVGCGAPERSAAVLPVLPASTLPELAAETNPVSASDLASDTSSAAAFESHLSDWGFVRGRARIFQGESKTLDRVVSRTLEFESADGARAYVRYLGEHPALLYGVGSEAAPVRIGARSGFVIDAASCACHRAAPTVLAVLAHGARVTYLEANGGKVSAASVRRLVARAP